MLNALVSGLVRVLYHRQIGYKKVQQQGRFANYNGNIALFLTAAFTAMLPGYLAYNGKYMATKIPYFGIFLMYCMQVFLEHDKQAKYSQNCNETHYSAVVLGGILGVFCRRYL